MPAVFVLGSGPDSYREFVIVKVVKNVFDSPERRAAARKDPPSADLMSADANARNKNGRERTQKNTGGPLSNG
jgi:hypothetical protein